MPERVPLLAPLAGAITVAAAVIAFAMAAGGEAPVNPLTGMTVVLGAVGGLAALLRPGRLWALAIADALVATAVVASMFGVGLYELAPLMLLGAATIRTPHRPAATSAPVALGEATPEPQRRTA